MIYLSSLQYRTGVLSNDIFVSYTVEMTKISFDKTPVMYYRDDTDSFDKTPAMYCRDDKYII
jgi:hypothetical protein